MLSTTPSTKSHVFNPYRRSCREAKVSSCKLRLRGFTETDTMRLSRWTCWRKMGSLNIPAAPLKSGSQRTAFGSARLMSKDNPPVLFHELDECSPFLKARPHKVELAKISKLEDRLLTSPVPKWSQISGEPAPVLRDMERITDGIL